MATRTVTGSWRAFAQDGSRPARSGTVTFEPSTLVRDAITNHIVVQDPVVATLDANGNISVELQTTDQEDLNPVGWHWNVTEKITGLTARRYSFLLPAGGVFDLSDVEVPYSAVQIDPDEIYIRGFEADYTVVGPTTPPSLTYDVTNSIATVSYSLPRSAAVSVGTTTAGEDFDDAAVADSGTGGDVVLDFTLPRATLELGDVTVVNPDQNPDVTDSGTAGASVFDFDLPRAPTFAVGTVTPGADETDAVVTDVGTDGDIVLDITVPRGVAATADLGTVTVVNPDQNPDVTNSGTTADAVFDFDLPRAAAVTLGTVTVVDPDQNPAVADSGTDGDVVLDIDLPRAPDFAIGTVTTLAPGSSATVTDVGVDGDIELDFELPRGADGDGTAYYGQMSSQTTQTVSIASAGSYVPMAITGTFDSTNSFGTVAPTTATFGVKNDSGATQLFTVVATADVEIGNNKTAGFRLAINGVAVTETTCTATTGTQNFAKLMTQWFVELDQGDEVSLLVANLTDTNDIDVDRSKIVAFTAGRQGEKGDKGDTGDSGVAVATAPITYDSGTQTVAWSGDTDDVPEGSNLYYTDARADARAIVFAIALGG